MAEVLTAHTDAVGEELILSLPIFAVFEIFLEDPFAYEALLQLALFSVLSVSFMKRNEEKYRRFECFGYGVVRPDIHRLLHLLFTYHSAGVLPFARNGGYVVPHVYNGLQRHPCD